MSDVKQLQLAAPPPRRRVRVSDGAQTAAVHVRNIRQVQHQACAALAQNPANDLYEKGLGFDGQPPSRSDDDHAVTNPLIYPHGWTPPFGLSRAKRRGSGSTAAYTQRNADVGQTLRAA